MVFLIYCQISLSRTDLALLLEFLEGKRKRRLSKLMAARRKANPCDQDGAGVHSAGGWERAPPVWLALPVIL